MQSTTNALPKLEKFAARNRRSSLLLPSELSGMVRVDQVSKDAVSYDVSRATVRHDVLRATVSPASSTGDLRVQLIYC